MATNSGSMENQKALMPVTPMRSPVSYLRHSENEESKILHSLNLRLQCKVHALEDEVGRLKKEVESYRGKHFIYDSLTMDLASLRTQLDKTALALLKKCEAYDSMKKELAVLKLQYNISPKSSQQSKISKALGSPVKQPPGNVKRKLSIYNDIMNMTDNDSQLSRRSSRPSMGSCGNIVKQISVEESMPSCLELYTTSTAPLRNRVLMKLHTLRSASTESLESVGRKSIKAQEINAATKSTTKPSTTIQTKKCKTNLDSSIQSSRTGIVKAAPSIRPALGTNNGRVIKVNTSIKKSNSSCSSKSGSSKPAFRF